MASQQDLTRQILEYKYTDHDEALCRGSAFLPQVAQGPSVITIGLMVLAADAQMQEVVWTKQYEEPLSSFLGARYRNSALKISVPLDDPNKRRKRDKS